MNLARTMMTPHMINKEARRLLFECGMFYTVWYDSHGQLKSIPIKNRKYDREELKQVKQFLASFENLIKLTYRPVSNKKPLYETRRNYLLEVVKILFDCYFVNEQVGPQIKKILLKIDQDFLDMMTEYYKAYPSSTLAPKITAFYEEVKLAKIAGVNPNAVMPKQRRFNYSFGRPRSIHSFFSLLSAAHSLYFPLNSISFSTTAANVSSSSGVRSGHSCIFGKGRNSLICSAIFLSSQPVRANAANSIKSFPIIF